MKRAQRRHHAERMKKRARNIARNCWGNLTPSDEWTVKMANHFKNCSCPLCGNPRKYLKGKEKLTIQERKHAA